jgi:hypothetical protein
MPKGLVTLFVALALAGCDYYDNTYYRCGGDAGQCEGETMRESSFSPGSKLHGVAFLDSANGPPNVIVPPVTVIDVKIRDGIPTVMTVSLARIGTNLENAVMRSEFEPVAHLQLGIGGQVFFADVDWIFGQMFSVCATQIRVDAGLEWIAPIPVPAAGPQGLPLQTLGASLSEGVIVHANRPQRTLGSNVALTPGGTAGGLGVAGSFAQYHIPPFATNFRVLARPNNAQLSVSVYGYDGAPQPAWYTQVASPSQEYPLPSDAVSVVVSNIGAANVDNHRIVFSLSL